MEKSMRKLMIGFFTIVILVSNMIAVVNAPVNIVAPISGGTVVNYFLSSFSVTCPGGPQTVKWDFDGAPIGSATYYDSFTTQFTHKLPSGWHRLNVTTDCGVVGSDRTNCSRIHFMPCLGSGGIEIIGGL